MTTHDPATLKKLATDQRHKKLIEASRKLARVVKHDDPPPEVCKARAKLEKSLPKWLRHHGAEAFCDDWSPDHLKVLKKIQTAIDKGGLFALAMPRGHGKTTILKWVNLYVMLTGKRRYVVAIGATAELAQAMVDFARDQLMESPTLHEHYPHVTTYARATDGKAIKARYQLRGDLKPSGIGWGKTTLTMPTPTGRDSPYPSDGGMIEAHGLTGAIRGKQRDDRSGKVLRPDFVLLDDPQTRESAESPSQCSMRERIIMGDVLGLAGPRKKIAAVMPCTVIRKGDLAHRFLDHAVHPEWQGETCALVVKWPDAQDTLWKEYADTYREGAAAGEGLAAATEFYRKNRKAMDAGAEVSWAKRVRDGEISALQTAENLLIETGQQFWAEYQNDPQDNAAGQYELTVEQILAHATDLPRLHLPERSAVLCGHIDINRVGLHWAMAGFDQQMTAHVAAYSRFPPHGELWPENAPELVIGQAITRGLTDLCNAIAGTAFIRGQSRMTPSLVLVDASFNSETVHRFCENWRGPFRVMPAIGRAASRYSWNKSTIIGRPMEQCHRQRPQKRICPYVMFNACYWREVAQRAFLGAPGEAGGCTLFNAGSPRAHGPFAEHVTAERLAEKFPSPAGDMVWKWNPPTGHNDWGDALTGAYVAAAMEGITTSGAPVETGIRRRKVYSAADFRK